MYRWIGVTKLIVAFRNFVNSLKSIRTYTHIMQTAGPCYEFLIIYKRITLWNVLGLTEKKKITQSFEEGSILIFIHFIQMSDRLCGLVVRVSGYRYRGLGFDSRRYQIF